jgi:hypothetical protein
MALKTQFRSASLALVCAAMLAQTNVASAITVELARKCEALTSRNSLRARWAIPQPVVQKAQG